MKEQDMNDYLVDGEPRYKFEDLNSMGVEQLLDIGINRNIVVYDSGAKGELSFRLVSLMQVISWRNNSGLLKEILIPDDAVVEDSKYYDLGDFAALGVNVRKISNPTKDFLSKDACLVTGKNNILIGICEKTVLLGAY